MYAKTKTDTISRRSIASDFFKKGDGAKEKGETEQAQQQKHSSEKHDFAVFLRINQSRCQSGQA